MKRQQFRIQTDDGWCDAYAFSPRQGASCPPVLMYGDAFGIRPATLSLAEQIAKLGFYVLFPDLVHRSGFRTTNAADVLRDDASRAEWLEHVVDGTTTEMAMRDTAAFLRHLQLQRGYRGKVGLIGYCIGGRIAVAAAARFPDLVSCAGAFHPGGLATDRPDSPHLQAHALRARVYIARAMGDPSFDGDEKERLTRAFDEAGVDYHLETYPAAHGWTMEDLPAYDAIQAGRHVRAVETLLSSCLRPRKLRRQPTID